MAMRAGRRYECGNSVDQLQWCQGDLVLPYTSLVARAIVDFALIPAGLAVLLGAAVDGIRVNAVRPGIIDTDIHASGGEPDRASRMAEHVPMQRAGSAQEVAQAIVWLLGDTSSYTTGTVLDVAGGR